MGDYCTSDIDVSKLYVCIYSTGDNEEFVGFFKEKKFTHNETMVDYNSREKCDGSIYLGIDSGLTGIVKTENGSDELIKTIGTTVEFYGGTAYAANCEIKKVMNFNALRLKMYQEGKIEAYNKTSPEDILEVLLYAANNYLSEPQKTSEAKIRVR